MQLIYNFIARKLATKLSKLLFIAIINAFGIFSVVGIPVAVIIDILFLLVAIQTLFSNINHIYIKSIERVKDLIPVAKNIFRITCIILGVIFSISLIFGIFSSSFNKNESSNPSLQNTDIQAAHDQPEISTLPNNDEQLEVNIPSAANNSLEITTPTISYESLYVSDEGVGYDQIFALESRGEDTMGQAINYQSKAGRVNVMEQVVENVEDTGYVQINYAYKFADQYVLIVSTGEHGNSCLATTYAFSYDTKSESVTGKTEIDGCSENVQAFAEGNKLTVKKDGKATTIYNGKV